MSGEVPPRARLAPLGAGDAALLRETGERVRILAEANQSGDFLVEDAVGDVLTVARSDLAHWGARRVGCGCCGG